MILTYLSIMTSFSGFGYVWRMVWYGKWEVRSELKSDVIVEQIWYLRWSETVQRLHHLRSNLVHSHSPLSLLPLLSPTSFNPPRSSPQSHFSCFRLEQTTSRDAPHSCLQPKLLCQRYSVSSLLPSLFYLHSFLPLQFLFFFIKDNTNH